MLSNLKLHSDTPTLKYLLSHLHIVFWKFVGMTKSQNRLLCILVTLQTIPTCTSSVPSPVSATEQDQEKLLTFKQPQIMEETLPLQKFTQNQQHFSILSLSCKASSQLHTTSSLRCLQQCAKSQQHPLKYSMYTNRRICAPICLSEFKTPFCLHQFAHENWIPVLAFPAFYRRKGCSESAQSTMAGSSTHKMRGVLSLEVHFILESALSNLRAFLCERHHY